MSAHLKAYGMGLLVATAAGCSANQMPTPRQIELDINAELNESANAGQVTEVLDVSVADGWSDGVELIVVARTSCAFDALPCIEGNQPQEMTFGVSYQRVVSDFWQAIGVARIAPR